MLLGLGIASATLSHASGALAQAQTFALDRAQLSGAPDDGFMVHRPYMDEETRLYGSMALGYSHAPLRKDSITNSPGTLNSASQPNPVDGQFILYPSIGVELLGRIGFNMHLPMVPYQFSNATPDFNVSSYAGAVGDFRLDARGVLWRSDDRRTSFGVEGFFTVATGRAVGFGGDRAGSAQLTGSFEHHFDGFFIAGQLGPHFRPRNGVGGTGQLFVGNELRWAVGAFLPMRDDEVRLGLEIWGGTGLESVNNTNTFFSNAFNNHLEWLAQARFLFFEDKNIYTNFGAGTRLAAGYGTADFRLLASIGYHFRLKDRKPKAPPPKVTIRSRPEHYEQDTDGDGYPDGIDNCPNDKEDGKKPKPTDGCPAESDRDNDGIPDRLDKCPDEPEDLDKIDDKDGCPETDADKDGLLDVVDECPLEPGPANADKTKNGCPTLTRVSEDGSIALLKNIEFDLGRATIKPVSFPILNEVVILLKARPEVRLSINGHTDSQGDRDRNMKLSKDRAAAVKSYLTGQGVQADRLTSEGYGPDKPIDTNDTAEGRAKNRRVEFLVIEEPASGESADW